MNVSIDEEKFLIIKSGILNRHIHFFTEFQIEFLCDFTLVGGKYHLSEEKADFLLLNDLDDIHFLPVLSLVHGFIAFIIEFNGDGIGLGGF